MPLDLTLSPLYRINGQEQNALPGLIALTPPAAPARGRDRDRLIAYLLLTGNAVIGGGEYAQAAADAAAAFYQTPGALTTALKAAAEKTNKILLERNMNSAKNGQFAVGWLSLAAVRESQCTLALSGPMHVYCFCRGEVRHIHEPAVSGKGLGVNQTPNIHYAQISLEAGVRLLFLGRDPALWKDFLADRTPGSLEAMRRRLLTLSNEDLSAVLMQATEGTGALNILGRQSTETKKEEPVISVSELKTPPVTEAKPSVESTLQEKAFDPPAAHLVQPSAYAIPPQEPPRAADPLASLPRGSREFPPSIPRIQPAQGAPAAVLPAVLEDKPSESGQTILSPRLRRRREPPEWTRRAAKTAAAVIQTIRRMKEKAGERLSAFLPRLLPTAEPLEQYAPSSFTMAGIAIAVPLIVVVVMFVVWTKYGRSQQYEINLALARQKREHALVLTQPIEQRRAWESVLLSVGIAESHTKTEETVSIRREAETKLDELLGITRLQFSPAFSGGLGIEISRMAASESDLFLLNAEKGEALRAQPSASGRGFQIDTSFNCKPGVYGNYTVGPLVDILTLPLLNSINATLLGIDAAGNLLYCAPGQVALAIPLSPPDTNWKRVTAFTLSGGNLYVLDAPARAVWVYTGKDGAFIDRPYFFFGGQTPEKQDVIDLLVSGDDLYMLHADGHLSACSYSRLETKPTRCEDPIPLINPFPAYQDENLFASAHFTQMFFAALPDPSILLLDADAQSVFRFSPRAFELQNQIRAARGVHSIPPGAVGAAAIAPNHVLYLAVNGQVYFAANMP